MRNARLKVSLDEWDKVLVHAPAVLRVVLLVLLRVVSEEL